MEIFAFLIVGGLAIAAVNGVLRWKQTHDAWPAAAHQLGLGYASGGLFGERLMQGTLSGCAVRISARSGGGDGSGTTIDYRIWYGERLPFELRLTAQRAVSAGLRASIGTQDLEIGVPVFDDRVWIKGDDLAAIRRALRPALQTSILRAMDTFPGLVIDSESLRCRGTDPAPDVADMVRNARRLADLASNVAASAGTRKGRPRPAEPAETPNAPRGQREPSRRAAPAPRTPPTPTRAPAPSATVTPPDGPSPSAGGGGPPVAELCTALFGGAIASYAVDEVFERDFRGRPVRWTGTLRSVARYPFDHVFGAEPGARAVLDIHELTEGYGERTIRAVVRVETDEEPRLRRATGRRLEFTGVLWRCDGFRRQIFVANGWVAAGE